IGPISQKREAEKRRTSHTECTRANQGEDMTTTQEIQPGRRIDLTREVVGLERADRRARLVDQIAGRPPKRIDGFTIGAPHIAGDPPHDGEMHPDGDELLYLVSGAVTVTLEL